MTPNELREWQTQMGLNTYTAPQALGVGRRTYMEWLSGETAISRVAALACAALAAGLDVPAVAPQENAKNHIK